MKKNLIVLISNLVICLFTCHSIMGEGVVHSDWGDENNGLVCRLKSCVLEKGNKKRTFLAKIKVEIKNVSKTHKKVDLRIHDTPVYRKGVKEPVTSAHSSPMMHLRRKKNNDYVGIYLYGGKKIELSAWDIGNISFEMELDHWCIKKYAIGSDLYVEIGTPYENPIENNVWEGIIRTPTFRIPNKIFKQLGFKIPKKVKKNKPVDDGKFNNESKAFKVKPKTETRDNLVYMVGETKPYTGSVIEYYNNGRKKGEVQYVDGIRHGKIFNWDLEGRIALEIDVKGDFDGFLTSFFKNGKVMWKRGFKSKEGEYYSWYKTGEKKHSRIPTGDKKGNIKETWWDKKGNVITEGILNNEDIDEKEDKFINGTFIVDNTLKTYKNGNEVNSKPLPNPPIDEPED